MNIVPLRFGVVVAGTTLPAWQIACLRCLAVRSIAELALRIEVQPPAEPSRGSHQPTEALRVGWWRWLEQRSRALVPASADAALATAALLRLPIAPNDWAAVVPVISDHNLDFILDLSNSGAMGGVLAAGARHGLWRFWHGPAAADGSAATYLGRPAAAGEPLRLALVAVRQHDARLLFEGFFRRRRSALRNLDRCLLAAGDCLAAACLRLPSHGASVGPAHPMPIGHRGSLSSAATLALLLQQGVSLLALAADIFRLDVWNIGLWHGPAAMALQGIREQPIEWMPEPPVLRYYADPLALPGRLGLLAEEFDYWTGRGQIQRLEVANWKKLRPEGLDTGLHMSYPYLFAHEEDVFCIPESAETGGIPLFRALTFPDRWEYVTTLIEDFPAVDGTLFSFGGIWWLFCGKYGDLSDTQLFVWHADSPFGPWYPHRQNPVKIDVRSSRPAGPPFLIDGTLYRPAQDCSRTYGGALAINRVVALDREHFAEEVAIRLEPDPAGPYPDGLHTLCAYGDFTLVDGKRSRFHVAAPALKAWSALAHRRNLRRRARAIADVS
jgi:hypothetical protein